MPRTVLPAQQLREARTLIRDASIKLAEAHRLAESAMGSGLCARGQLAAAIAVVAQLEPSRAELMVRLEALIHQIDGAHVHVSYE